MDPEIQIRMPLDVPSEEVLSAQPVFPLIHAIKNDIEVSWTYKESLRLLSSSLTLGKDWCAISSSATIMC